ncbi:MAG: hypothetical protein AAGG48_22805 [Planctomycetota bacterium]
MSTVKNGEQVEVAELSAESIERIVVPASWKVRKSATGSESISLSITKRLEYFGFPSEQMSIKTSAPSMGVIIQRSDREVSFRHFGGFSTIEGGTSIEVEIAVPSRIEIEVVECDSVRRHEFPEKLEGDWTEVSTDIIRRERL